MNYFAGVDWGSVEHAACVIDQEGAVVTRLDVPHTAEGLRELLAALARIAPPEELPIAIERPSGLVVDTLIDAGHPVVPIHPNALKASRSRYRAAGGKSDPGDAYILADVLRTDGHRFRALRPASDEIRALRALVRTRDDLVAERVAIANQLRALLESFWPGAAVIFADVDSPIALAFLERYPTPRAANRLGEKRLAAFLAHHAYCGRRSPSALLERLRAAPRGLAGDAEEEAKGELVKGLVAVLGTLVLQIKKTTAAVEHAVAQLPAGRVVMSFPRAGKVNAAQILAELGDDPECFKTEDQLAAEAGVAPVTHESGKHRGVVFRFACNKRLRRAVTTWADNSRHASPWARHVYRKARARGCDHPHAIRILARAWIRVLWRCWRDLTPYDEALHGAAKPFLEPEA
ncbi:MAG: IS110 family RNA-guided transposase [Planctomycetota bacterium]|jgi:transposase